MLGACLEVEMFKRCTALLLEAHLEVKIWNAQRVRSTWKLRCAESARLCGMARITCPSQNVQNTSTSEHFWKLRCWKSARCCGAKHISMSNVQNNASASELFWKLRYAKSTCRCSVAHISKSKLFKKTGGLGALFEVKMSKRCTPLWREADFEVNMWTSFGRSTGPRYTTTTTRTTTATTTATTTTTTTTVTTTTATNHYTTLQLQL